MKDKVKVGDLDSTGRYVCVGHERGRPIWRRRILQPEVLDFWRNLTNQQPQPAHHCE